jgi:hypothetical protein
MRVSRTCAVERVIFTGLFCQPQNVLDVAGHLVDSASRAEELRSAQSGQQDVA